MSPRMIMRRLAEYGPTAALRRDGIAGEIRDGFCLDHYLLIIESIPPEEEDGLFDEVRPCMAPRIIAIWRS